MRFHRLSECTSSAFGTYLRFHNAVQLPEYVRDTVSSVGFTRGKLFPRTREVDHICFFRHALALDERRVKFHPEYVRGGVGPPLEIPTTKEATTTRRRRNSVVTPETPQKKVPPQQPTRVTAKLRVKEVWFPGTHSDM